MHGGGQGFEPPAVHHFAATVGKLFTTTLMKDMARHGELALDDSIERHLPADMKAPSWRGRSITWPTWRPGEIEPVD